MMTHATWLIASPIPILSYYCICPSLKIVLTFPERRCVIPSLETPVHSLLSLILMVNGIIAAMAKQHLCILEPEEKPRMGVVITARVHPGETNSSWIMQGLLDFLTSECTHAKVR